MVKRGLYQVAGAPPSKAWMRRAHPRLCEHARGRRTSARIGRQLVRNKILLSIKSCERRKGGSRTSPRLTKSDHLASASSVGPRPSREGCGESVETRPRSARKAPSWGEQDQPTKATIINVLEFSRRKSSLTSKRWLLTSARSMPARRGTSRLVPGRERRVHDEHCDATDEGSRPGH